MALLVERVRMPILSNKQHGFTLIELLIVLLIVGVLLGAVGISVNNLSGKQQQVKTLTQLKNQIQAAQHDAQFFNFEMRIAYNDLDKFKNIAKGISDFLEADLGKYTSRKIGEKKILEVGVQVFNISSGEWEASKSIKIVEAEEGLVQFSEPYIYIKPNGFITDTSGICVETECMKINEK